MQNNKICMIKRTDMKILIIDDNQSITGMLSKMLKLEGYETVVSNDGKNGLSLIENNHFDAVILDLAMPEFSGIDIIESLNKSGKLNEQKILVLTASSPSDDAVEKIKSLGVKNVLNKPIDPQVLLELLKN